MLFRDDLQAVPVSLSYDFLEHTGKLQLSPGQCADMSGCLALFTAIDPFVTSIVVLDADKTAHARVGTLYQRDSDGHEWRAYRPFLGHSRRCTL